LCERAKCRHGGVFGGGEELVHELVPVAVGVEYERVCEGAADKAGTAIQELYCTREREVSG
jgi:hypothetical protein